MSKLTKQGYCSYVRTNEVGLKSYLKTNERSE